MGAVTSSTPPYVLAAIISAIPATLAASSAWYSAHKGRKEGHDDTGKVTKHLEKYNERFDQIDTKFERIDTHFARMDLRFDTIEDKVERHLGWHRNEAATTESLTEALSKEYTGDYPTYQPKPVTEAGN